MRLEVGDRVVIEYGDVRSYGTVTQVNDEDQGDFEYYVNDDDGTGSFWPRECLTLIKEEV